jgi:NAD(P)-dependent dehydrogenase (short-subunit alcohol dehydrogenase family)
MTITQQPVAVITGGAAGIGRAIAVALAKRGHAVEIFDIDEAAPRTAATLTAEGGAVTAHIVDVGDERQVKDAFAAVEKRHGRLDALVNNAGINIRKPVTDLTLAEWNRVIGTNLTAAFLTARAGAALLRATRGAIVNIASTRAAMSEPNTEAYAATKGGLVALTHALAISLGPEVRVNCISPGWIHTHGETLSEHDHAQHPAGRVGQPEDIAALAAFLLGAESGFVTGANFVVDGGMTRKMIYVQ